MDIHDEVAKALGVAPPELESFSKYEYCLAEALLDHIVWTEWFIACRRLRQDVRGVKFGVYWEYDDEGGTHPYIDWMSTKFLFPEGVCLMLEELDPHEFSSDVFEDLGRPRPVQLNEGFDFTESPLAAYERYFPTKWRVELQALQARITNNGV